MKGIFKFVILGCAFGILGVVAAVSCGGGGGGSTPVANKSPTATAQASHSSGTTPLTVYFTGSCEDTDGTCESYHWNFGEGNTSTLQNPNHEYTYVAAYTIILTVTDDDGAAGTDTLTITVSEPQTGYPSGVTLSPDDVYVTTSLVKLFWSQSSASDFGSYSVYYSTSPVVTQSSTLSGSVTESTKRHYVVTELSAGTEYYFKVYVCDTDGDCTGSNELSATTGIGNEWITVSAGDFIMGCASTDSQCTLDETPRHTVNLSQFQIHKYEVTNAQYAIFLTYALHTEGVSICDSDVCGDGAHLTDTSTQDDSVWVADDEYADHPVVNVKWLGASQYCEWIGGRLPTEAEWEKSARGSGSRQVIYPWGNAISGEYANYWESGDPYDNGTTIVGYYDGSLRETFSTSNNASYYGAMDMAGNAWEWVSDWYDYDYYSSSPSSNPQGSGSGTYRVFRGGSWHHSTEHLRVSNRGRNYPEDELTTTGFRCARDS